MNIKKNLPFALSILLGSTLVALYQLPSIENSLNKYGFALEINDSYPYSRNFQQSLEDSKIALSSTLDDTIVFQLETKKENITPVISKPLVVENKPLIAENKVSVPTIAATTDPLINQETKASLSEDEQLVTTNSEHNITEVVDSTLNKVIINNVNLPCVENCKILMLGDSVMGDVSFALQRLLHKERPNWKLIDAHKVSSGLSNQNYYNWPATANKLIEENKPDYTLILIGTNDAQGFTSNGKGHAFGKDDWKEEYSSRIDKMISLFNITHWSWVELPVANDIKFNDKLEIIRNLQNTNSKEHYIETKSILGKRDSNGSVDMKLRAGDGIHLNTNGANLLAKHIASKMFYIEVTEVKNTNPKKS